MKKTVPFFLILMMLFFVNSCAEKEKNTIDFSISYLKETAQIETQTSISKKKLVPLISPNIGFKNGVYWFKIKLNNQPKSNHIVFEFNQNTASKIAIYSSLDSIPYKIIKGSNYKILVDNSTQNNMYFIKANFEKQVFFDLKIKNYLITEMEQESDFFKMGLYYGFAFMVIIGNLFFFISLKDYSFLYYSFFLLSITITISCYDGLLALIINPSIFYLLEFGIHFFVALFGAIFANHFLNIKEYFPKSYKLGRLFLILIALSYLLFIIYKNYVFISIGDSLCLLTLLYYWILGFLVIKKHDFALFFLIGYFFILFSSILFLTPLNWGLHMFSISINTIKFGSVFEMLILTYAITHRVQILQKENNKIKQQIKNYLIQIQHIETTNFVKNKIEELIKEHHLSEREADVLLFIFKGYTNQRIGKELFISLNTVKYHIRNIYEKLNINSKNEVIDLISTIK